MEKQIEKIELILMMGGECMVPVPWKTKQQMAKEIASLYEGWYPGEFVEWCIINTAKAYPFGQIIELENHNEFKTLPELFKWWQDNVEGK